MRVYVVDAFNLSHKVFPENCQEDNHQFIIDFIWKNSLKGSDRNGLVLVFDGGLVEGLQGRGFKLKFGNSRKADEVIKDFIAKVPARTELIVVSDDNEIKSFARTHEKKTCSIAEFISKSHLGAKSPGCARGAKNRGGRDHSSEKSIPKSLEEKITAELTKLWVKEK